MNKYLRSRKLKGLTLLEIIISIAIFALVATSISLIFNRALFVYRESTDKNEAVQQAQTAMEWLVRDIQSAYAIVKAEATDIAVVSPEQHYIRYYLDGTTIQRKVCIDQPYLLAEDVTQFSFKCYDSDNNEIAIDADGHPEDILSLKTVEIDITTEKNNQNFQLNTVARFEFNPDYTWAKAYGGLKSEYFNSLQQTPDGGYILGGHGQPSLTGPYDFLVIKTNASGTPQWAKSYSGLGLGYQYFYSLQQTLDGGCIFGGYAQASTGPYDFLVIKTNASGTPQWAKTYGGLSADQFRSLQQTSDGGYILGGYTWSFGVSNWYDILVIKTNAEGYAVTYPVGHPQAGQPVPDTWAKTYGGLKDDCLNSLQQTPDGGYILSGYTNSFGAVSYDFLLIKTNAEGYAVTYPVGHPQAGQPVPGTWAKTYGGLSNEHVAFVQQTSDGGYILGGYTYSFGAGDSNLLLIKTNAEGYAVTYPVGHPQAGQPVPGTWAKTYGGSDVEYLYSLQQTPDGGYIFGGNTTSFGADGSNFLLIKTNALGTLQWAKTYGLGSDSLHSLQQTPDGGYILGGYTNSFGVGSTDFSLIKTDALGNLSCCGIVNNVSPTVIDASLTVTEPSPTVTEPSPTVTEISLTVTSPNITTTLVCPSPPTSGSSNFPPYFTAPIGDKTASVGVELSFTIYAADPENNTIHFGCSGIPIGSSYVDHGDGTATFRWTPSGDDVGDNIMVFTIYDDYHDYTEMNKERVTITVVTSG